MKTNLIYHIAPFRGNEVWIKNIQCLLKYIRIFNNKKIVNVATGENCHNLEEVKKYFAGYDAEFITTPNNPELRETASFIKLLEKVYSLDSGEITFYAHTKGVSRASGGSCGEAVRLWYEYMYRYNLSNIEKVREILKKYPCCGYFKIAKQIPWFPEFSRWHYSGTFFWFNNYALFSKNWQDIALERFGTEAYLSRFFSSKEAYALFMNYKHELYDIDYWQGVVLPFERLTKVNENLFNRKAVLSLITTAYFSRKFIQENVGFPKKV